MTPMRIRIVGGSLGGLFAAALLRQDGHDVVIYERSVGGLGGRGAGLVPQQEVFTLLDRLGAGHVAEIGVVALERITLARDGGIAHRERRAQMQISWDRLYAAVADLIPAQAYRLDSPVRAVDQDAHGAIVHFEEGGSEPADLVIGADGVGSVVRAAVVGGPDASRYAGYVAWRGLVPEQALPVVAAEPLLDRFAFYMMPRSHMLGYLVAGADGEVEPGERRYNWVWYRRIPAEELAGVLTDPHGKAHPFSLAPGQVTAAHARTLQADAQALLPPPFAAAVAAEPRPFVQAIFDYEAPRMVNGRIILLGDAAFVVRPHTAMGVSKAAGDAMALRAHLASAPLAAALSGYEAERLEVGRAIAAYGQRLGADLE